MRLRLSGRLVLLPGHLQHHARLRLRPLPGRHLHLHHRLRLRLLPAGRILQRLRTYTSTGTYTSTTACAAFLVGATSVLTLAQIQAITTGTLICTVNGTTGTVATLNLSAATSLSNAATLIGAASPGRWFNDHVKPNHKAVKLG